MQPLDGGEIGERSLLALQTLERGPGERIVDGAQAVRPLGMTLPRVVQQAGWMGDEEGRHGWIDTLTGLGTVA